MNRVLKNQLLTAGLLILGLVASAQADMWMWVDAAGDTHFVDSKTPIYTWTDEQGRVFYADTPEDDSAVSVELIWVSGGTMDINDADPEPSSTEGGRVFAEESAEDVAARVQARKEFCEKATAAYDAYIKAPRLYKSNDNGEKVYLSSKEAKRIIAETKAKKDEACN